MKIFRFLAVAGALLLLCGCVTHHHTRHPHGMPPGQAKKMGCSHHHGCGHVIVNGVWVSADVTPAAAPPPGHVKNRGKK